MSDDFHPDVLNAVTSKELSARVVRKFPNTTRNLGRDHVSCRKTVGDDLKVRHDVRGGTDLMNLHTLIIRESGHGFKRFQIV